MGRAAYEPAARPLASGACSTRSASSCWSRCRAGGGAARRLAFGRLPGAGLGFAKPLGLLLVTWAVWIAGSLGIASYGSG